MAQKVSEIEDAILSWLEKVVIGLNLCPFARKPFEGNKIRIITEVTDQYDEILERMLAEFQYLDRCDESLVETSLIVVPNSLHSFSDYLCCLSDVNELLVSEGYEGVYQIASFHPDYQFEGTSSDDKSNYTNRAPFPVFHIIREESLEKSLEKFKDPEAIPERNIELLESMDDKEIKNLFPWDH